jgi:hypothetical protein
MSRHRGRKGPSDPQAILAANALKRGQARQAQRQVDKTPELWGVSAEILQLPSHAEVDLVANRGRIVQARRCDPFDLLHSAGGLTDDQHRAARRLMRDWCIAAGVRDQERPELGKIDGGSADPQQINQAMIDADGRRAKALKAIGGVNGRLMSAVIGRMVDELAQVFVWRAVVEKVTGERDRNVQGALMRQACESLLLHFDEEDTRRRAERDAAAGGTPKHLRSFGDFGGEEVA